MTAVKSSISTAGEPLEAQQIYPNQPAATGNVVQVCSVEQQSMRFTIPHKMYSVIIKGTHYKAQFRPFIDKSEATIVKVDDWEYIQKRWSGHPSLSNGRIFVEKNDKETTARANDSETQELAKLSGSAQLSEKDLVGSTVQAKGAQGGVTDATVV